MKRSIFYLLLLLFISCHQEKRTHTPEVTNSFYDKAWSFSDKAQVDSSFIYFNKAKEEALKNHDSLKAAKSLINMAIISGDQGDYFGSQELSLSAIKYLNIDDDQQKEILSSNYNNLGKIARLLKKPDEANDFYLKAIALSNNQVSKNIYENNIAINLSDQKKYLEALTYFQRLISQNDIKKNNINFSRLLTNIAFTKWLQNPAYHPEAELLEALSIRIKDNDLWGQNASYARLADYYTTKKPDSALSYAYKMYKVAKRLNSADDQLEALQKLIKLSPPTTTKQYFESYQKVADSVQTARNAAKNQFALIRYETEKNKADNLILQKENAEKKYQIFFRELLLLAAVFLFIAAFIIAVLWYKKRKQRMELEAQNALHDSQLKTSKKVHDVVANGLYRMMTEIENQDAIDKEHVLDNIEALYEKSRDISYDKPIIADQHFHESISELLASFATENTKILIVGNAKALWGKVNDNVRYEITHILQELMVNMGKHSRASHVVLKFEQRAEQINIYYTDNGIGLSNEVQHKNGLRNTGNRIATIKGAIIFDNQVEKGLKIKISFPFS